MTKKSKHNGDNSTPYHHQQPTLSHKDGTATIHHAVETTTTTSQFHITYHTTPHTAINAMHRDHPQTSVNQHRHQSTNTTSVHYHHNNQKTTSGTVYYTTSKKSCNNKNKTNDLHNSQHYSIYQHYHRRKQQHIWARWCRQGAAKSGAVVTWVSLLRALLQRPSG